MLRPFALVLFTICFFSCKKSGEPVVLYTQWTVTSVAGEHATLRNQSLPITVYWPYSSGCDVVDKFEEERQGNIILVKTFGYVRGGVCTMDAGIKSTVYHFTPVSKGTYELRFLNIDHTYISHSVIVN